MCHASDNRNNDLEIIVDAKSKFIDKYKVTDASVHDSQPLDDLLTEDDKGQELYADSAYTGDDQEKVVSKYEMNNCIHEKGYRNKPLTDEKKIKTEKNQKQGQEWSMCLDLWSKV